MHAKKYFFWSLLIIKRKDENLNQYSDSGTGHSVLDLCTAAVPRELRINKKPREALLEAKMNPDNE